MKEAKRPDIPADRKVLLFKNVSASDDVVLD